MKRLFLLFLGTACGSVMFGQDVNRKIGTAPARTAAQDKVSTTSVNSNVVASKKTRQALESFWTAKGTKEVVGRTTYDLQTNGAIQRRVLQSGNTISCGWTHSTEAAVDETAPFNDRGSGYNYFDGTNWLAQPTSRLENLRTGFGGFAGTNAGSELYLSHDGNGYNIIQMKKTGSTWAQSTLFNTSPHTALWPHAATSGNYMYVLTTSSDSNIHSNGIRLGVFLSRSNDNGQTWIDNQIPVPLLDSSNMYRAGANSYSISASGNNVAMLFGDMGGDVTLISSTDNGNTWTKTIIWNWPIDFYNFAGNDVTKVPGSPNAVDTLWTVDGSHSVTFDKDGKIHAAFPLVRVFKDGSSTGYRFFFNAAMAYWNSDMSSVPDSILVLDQFGRDCDGDGVVGIGDNYVGTNTGDPDCAYNSIGTLTMPTITTTNTTPVKVMVAYTSLIDSDTTTTDPFSSGPGPNNWEGASAFDGQNFRDVMMIGSSDFGATWTEIVNISGTGHFEEVYPSTAENVSGSKLAILYQADNEPGTLMQNDDSPDPYWKNMMICQVVSIDSFFNTWGKDTNSACAQIQLPLSTSNIATLNGTVGVYPNPSTDVVYVDLKLNATSKQVTFQVTDLTGRVVYNEKATNVTNLKKAINVASLNSGNYILQVISDSGKYTEKITKE